MRKLVYITLIVIFIFAACSDNSGAKKFTEYDKEIINFVNKLNELEFNPEIPKLLPFEPTEAKVDMMSVGGTENNFVTISFISENLDEIILRAGIAENAIDFTEDEIKITESLTGTYGEEGKTKILKWEKDNIYYELFANNDFISKNDILEIAKSFYQID